MGEVRSGDYKNAACFFVEAVNDPGTKIAVDRRQSPEVVKQCVDQRARMVTRSGMHNHSCGLVDDNHIPVLVKDLQWQVLRFSPKWRRCSGRDQNCLGAFDQIRSAGWLPVHCN